MDSRAKQRLTGAVILVAVFVLLVPELLTGPGKDAQPTAAAKEDGVHSYTIDIDAPTSSVAPANTPEPAVSLPAPTPANPMSAPTVVAEPANPVASPPSSSDVGPPAEKPFVAPPKPVAQPQPAPAAVAAVAPAPEKPAPTVAAAIPKPVAAPKGSFVVQLGSFGSRENADRLVKDMVAKGFTAFIAPITSSNGRELYRVRVGPTRDRPAAEALATELRRAGQSGSIVPIS